MADVYALELYSITRPKAEQKYNYKQQVVVEIRYSFFVFFLYSCYFFYAFLPKYLLLKSFYYFLKDTSALLIVRKHAPACTCR